MKPQQPQVDTLPAPTTNKNQPSQRPIEATHDLSVLVLPCVFFMLGMMLSASFLY